MLRDKRGPFFGCLLMVPIRGRTRSAGGYFGNGFFWNGGGLYLYRGKDPIQLAKYLVAIDRLGSIGVVIDCGLHAQREFVAGSVLEDVIVLGIGLLGRVSGGAFDCVEFRRAQFHLRGCYRQCCGWFLAETAFRFACFRKGKLLTLRGRQLGVHAHIEKCRREVCARVRCHVPACLPG
jgi:hypothetical protein